VHEPAWSRGTREAGTGRGPGSAYSPPSHARRTTPAGCPTVLQSSGDPGACRATGGHRTMRQCASARGAARRHSDCVGPGIRCRLLLEYTAPGSWRPGRRAWPPRPPARASACPPAPAPCAPAPGAAAPSCARRRSVVGAPSGGLCRMRACTAAPGLPPACYQRRPAWAVAGRWRQWFSAGRACRMAACRLWLSRLGCHARPPACNVLHQQYRQ